MRHMAVLILAALLPAGMSDAAPAGTYDGEPKIFLHLTPAIAKNACGEIGPGYLANCSNAATAGQLNTPYYVYLVAARGDLPGIAGLQCGISYQQDSPANENDGIGLDVFGWTLCAALEFITPSASAWPEAGGGSIITWDSLNDCQQGETAVAGYFYVTAYSSDVLYVTARPADDAAKVADCDANEYILDPALSGPTTDLGYVAFSAGQAEPGCNSCTGFDCPTVDYWPGPPPPQPPSVFFHVETASGSPGTCTAGALSSCAAVNTKGGLSSPAGPFYHAYLVANPGSYSVKRMRVGIGYQDGESADERADGVGIDILNWTLCGDSEAPVAGPPWPAPGSANQITWNDSPACSSGLLAVAGYFYIAAYSADTLRAVAPGGAPTIVACTGHEWANPSMGYAVFSAEPSAQGCKPCTSPCPSIVATIRTTWSGIKTLIRPGR